MGHSRISETEELNFLLIYLLTISKNLVHNNSMGDPIPQSEPGLNPTNEQASLPPSAAETTYAGSQGEQGDTVVTEGALAAKAEEARKANIDLMNRMLESRKTQGDYFFDVGEGEDMADHALLLREPGEIVGESGEARQDFVAVTVDGLVSLVNPQRRTIGELGMTYKDSALGYFRRDKEHPRAWVLKRYNDPNYPGEIILNPRDGMGSS